MLGNTYGATIKAVYNNKDNNKVNTLAVILIATRATRTAYIRFLNIILTARNRIKRRISLSYTFNLLSISR